MSVSVREASLVDALFAFCLLVRNYVEKEYLPLTPTVENFKKYRKILVALLKKDSENEKTLVAKDGVHVVGTISYCVRDGALPIEHMFVEQLAHIRKEHPRIAYIGNFATNHQYSCTRLALRMMRDVEDVCRARGADAAVCVVNPDHVGLYEKRGFTIVAELPAMEGLTQKARAVLLLKTAYSASRTQKAPHAT